MLILRNIAARPVTVGTGTLIFLVGVLVSIAQGWWRFPLEQFASPVDILGLILGLLLAVSAWGASRTVENASSSRTFARIAGLFLVLTIVEYLLDAGVQDIPIALFWLGPGLVLLFSPSVTKNSARLCIRIAVGIETVEFGRSVLSFIVYGQADLPAVFVWIETQSDLLLRAFYLLAFIEIMNNDLPFLRTSWSFPAIRRSSPLSVNARAIPWIPVNASGSLYQQFREVLLSKTPLGLISMLSITATSIEYSWFKLLHPDLSFADHYAIRVARRLDRGGGHVTLGKRQRFAKLPFSPIDMIGAVDQRKRGRQEFEFLRAVGLEPAHVCVDYGCGSLRIGQHIIAYLEPFHYWGLDVTDRFYGDGLDVLPPSLVSAKRPNLRVISSASVMEAAARKPDYVICYKVLHHVPPAESGIFFDRIASLMSDNTKLVFSFREATTNRRIKGASWVRDASTVRRLIYDRLPSSKIDFHSNRGKDAETWLTVVVVT